MDPKFLPGLEAECRSPLFDHLEHGWGSGNRDSVH